MSVREVIWFFKQFDTNVYLDILKNEHGANGHPNQEGAYVVDELPFYEPFETGDFVHIISFNKTPLPGILIDALTNHPELALDNMLVIWTIEQEILLETTIGELRGKKVEIDEAKRQYFRELAQIPLLLL
jgi:hypothetical protein